MAMTARKDIFAHKRSKEQRRILITRFIELTPIALELIMGMVFLGIYFLLFFSLLRMWHIFG